jgi:hypothetical protein
MTRRDRELEAGTVAPRRDDAREVRALESGARSRIVKLTGGPPAPIATRTNHGARFQLTSSSFVGDRHGMKATTPMPLNSMVRASVSAFRHSAWSATVEVHGPRPLAKGPGL